MEERIVKFRKKIIGFYNVHKRDFPWRRTNNAYEILVSEIMLQQTQTARVVDKYLLFIETFPNFESLAKAPQSEVLKLWQGLGYNRRALYLKRTAEIIVDSKIKTFTLVFLQSLPGIGPNTAGAIYVFSYNKPYVFIETNIRRVFIHEFFSDKEIVNDKDVYPLIEASLDRHDPRNWYYALMDYGVFLARGKNNPNRKSTHYKKQTRFEGSIRQVRGRLLKLLIHKSLTEKQIYAYLANAEDAKLALNLLIKEGFIVEDSGKFTIKP